MVERLPNESFFYHGNVPTALDKESREWLHSQLHHWPERINEERTCAIGALTDLAVTEYCRMRDRILARIEALESTEVDLIDARFRGFAVTSGDVGNTRKDIELLKSLL
jgi:hypothetical protein